ncbi:MAG: TSUP family transporter, partial [Acidimicrobiia bacterium]|nr:TSUP family transporter [Acidimicrobiia bacterium]
LLILIAGLGQHQAHATSLAIVIFAAASAAAQYVLRDQVDWGLTVGLAVGGVIGAQIGARTMKNLPERRLRTVFAVFLIFVGARLVIWG